MVEENVPNRQKYVYIKIVAVPAFLAWLITIIKMSHF